MAEGIRGAGSVSVSLALAWAIGGAVFGAGGLVMLLRLLKKDVDGLGGRVRNLDDSVKVLLMAVVPDDKRQWLAEMLLRR